MKKICFFFKFFFSQSKKRERQWCQWFKSWHIHRLQNQNGWSRRRFVSYGCIYWCWNYYWPYFPFFRKLSASTLAALLEFSKEEEQRQEEFERLQKVAQDKYEETQMNKVLEEKGMELFQEDWGLSQFWVSRIKDMHRVVILTIYKVLWWYC